MENGKCKNDELELIIRAKQNVRFKAGSDLSTKVNRVIVDVNEDSSGEQHVTEISIHLVSEDCKKDQQN